MGLKVSQRGIQAVVEHALYFERPLEVVVNGGGFGAQALGCVRGIGKQDVGNVLVQSTDAVAARQSEATEPLGQGAVVVLEAREVLCGRLADLLLKRNDHVADQFGEPFRRPTEGLDGRALVAQGDADLLEGVVGLQGIDRLLACGRDFTPRDLELDFAGHQHGGDDVARRVW